MPRRAPQRITAWSFSRWSTYDTCPAQAKYQIIHRIPIEQNAAMARGQEVHKTAEDYVQKGGRMPKPLELFDEEFKAVRKLVKSKHHDVMVEQKWAFRRDWTPCEYFAKDCWLRVVVDLAILNRRDNLLTIVDHKTGKVRDNHGDQLKLYGAAGFAQFPSVETVQAELWYLDQGIINNEENEPMSWTADEFETLTKFWESKTKKMFNDQVFKPNPTRLCEYCSYSKSNDGPCEY